MHPSRIQWISVRIAVPQASNCADRTFVGTDHETNLLCCKDLWSVLNDGRPRNDRLVYKYYE